MYNVHIIGFIHHDGEKNGFAGAFYFPNIRAKLNVFDQMDKDGFKL